MDLYIFLKNVQRNYLYMARLEFALDWLELILFGKSDKIEIKA